MLARMNRNLVILPMMTALLAGPTSAVDVVLSGGVAVKSWEKLRGPNAHDNWWANFIRGATVRIDQLQKKNPKADITWIVYRPAYLTRGKEDGQDYITMIREQASKRKVKLVFVNTGDEAFKAINKAARGKKKIDSFYYFGHSNAHAFMLDYSSDIIGVSKQWMHENDLADKLNKAAFNTQAECWSYGCYTGNSMSAKWKDAIGIPLWGNTASTRYQPVGWGELPSGAGEWVR